MAIMTAAAATSRSLGEENSALRRMNTDEMLFVVSIDLITRNCTRNQEILPAQAVFERPRCISLFVPVHIS
jgi:hypothetical protein